MPQLEGYGYDAARSRLGVSVEVLQTTSPEKARGNLIGVLENGDVPIVWADTLTLGYERSEPGEGMWTVTPLVVYSLDAHEARIADRADVPLIVASECLDEARGRVKKHRFRIATLDLPSLDELPAAVEAGIRACTSLYTEKPPKGSAQSWGIRGLRRWAELLRDPRKKGSWAQWLRSPRELFAGLTTAYRYGFLFWKDGSESADRHLYGDFLDEAAVIQGRPALTEAGSIFRVAGDRWMELASTVLPERFPFLARARGHMHRRHSLFLAAGTAKVDELLSMDEELVALTGDSAGAQLTDGERGELYDEISGLAESIADVEESAVARLRDAMS